MVGDLRHGRTVHSLTKLLCHYKDITLHYVSPVEELQMPDDICKFVQKNSDFTQVDSLKVKRLHVEPSRKSLLTWKPE